MTLSHDHYSFLVKLLVLCSVFKMNGQLKCILLLERVY